jgi:RHS repeat-associated protein
MNTGNLKTANIYGSGLIGRVDLSGGATGGYYERMYYVKDHLGSIRVGISSVTTTNNNTTYACDYYPFGETLREYTAGSNKYKFTEKERDNETSYDYFGARYYNNKLGVWLSADPKSSKYPSFNPYNYSLNNPINNYDPDGKEVYPSKSLSVAQKNAIANTYNKSESFSKMYDAARSRSDIAVRIQTMDAYTKSKTGASGITEVLGKNESGKLEIVVLIDGSSEKTLGHELEHVAEIMNNSDVKTQADYNKWLETNGIKTGNGTLCTKAAQETGNKVEEEVKASNKKDLDDNNKEDKEKKKDILDVPTVKR